MNIQSLPRTACVALAAMAALVFSAELHRASAVVQDTTVVDAVEFVPDLAGMRSVPRQAAETPAVVPVATIVQDCPDGTCALRGVVRSTVAAPIRVIQGQRVYSSCGGIESSASDCGGYESASSCSGSSGRSYSSGVPIRRGIFGRIFRR